MKKSVIQEPLFFERREFPITLEANKTSSVMTFNSGPITEHEEIEIKYFYEGSATLLVDTTPIVTQPGDIVIINPYESHTTVDVGPNNGKYHLLMIGMDFFSSKNLDNFDMRYLLLGSRVKFNNLVRGNIRARKIISRIVEEMTEKQTSYELAVRGLVLELFALLLRGEINRFISKEKINDSIRFYASIEPAVREIRNNYDKKLKVEELAELCNLSKYHFCRVFKRATGMTAIQYLTEYKLGIADIMLNNSDESIAEIANSSGFDDENYFSRCYKKSRGVSPKKVRNRVLR